MNYGGMAVEGIWRGMNFANQQKQMALAQQQQAFQNQMAQQQMAMQQQAYQTQLEQQKRENALSELDYMNKGLGNYMKLAEVDPSIAKQYGQAYIQGLGKAGIDVSPFVGADTINNQYQQQRQEATDIEMYKMGLGRVPTEDQELGMSVMPPTNALQVGQGYYTPMPPKLPETPIEWKQDAEGNFVGLPSRITGGNVPDVIKPGVKGAQSGGQITGFEASRQWYMKNFNVDAKEADRLVRIDERRKNIENQLDGLRRDRMMAFLSLDEKERRLDHPALQYYDAKMRSLEDELSNMLAPSGSQQNTQAPQGSPIELNVPGLGKITGTVR